VPLLLKATIAGIPERDKVAEDAARARFDRLTKPTGSLGRLEPLASALAGMCGRPRPRLARKVVVVCAADHGVAGAGVSAYPQAVTAQMLANFLRGGAAINVLARQVGAEVRVVDLGVLGGALEALGEIPHKIALGTRDLSREPAMTREQAERALEAGIALAERADVIATGDMGIGNTTAGAAVVAAMTGRPADQVVGNGTGIDADARARKLAAIEAGLARGVDAHDPVGVLASVGGFEIGALAGLVLGAAARRIPVVLDGLASGAAALLACALAPRARDYCIAGHVSAEPGHRVTLEQLGLEPLLDLGLRLGEGTGAALALPLLDSACRLLDEMATFDEAQVSDR
jgi:nicotinate-nucleotide--dimethylbenzimidazole phosphoribosyltransferase